MRLELKKVLTMNNAKLIGVVFAATLILGAGCATMKTGFMVPAEHPEDLSGTGRPQCVECHDAAGEKLNFSRFNHTNRFVKNHRVEAYQDSPVCGMCHAQSFCNDCHAVKVELKPSIKTQGETYRTMPHRGDYITRHRIDAKLDPTSCVGCHGSPKSAETCTPCHGQ